jgi:UDP-N-acetylmuramoylalanine--D-glutamate ligase
MTSRPPLPPGPYLVVGLARSGRAAARMLASHGEVIAVDAGTPDVEGLAFEAHVGADGVALLDRVRTVVKSPGVPREAPVVAEALRRGIEVIGELELAWRALPNRFVAVTGTNGKTTTVELAGEMFRAADMPVAVAGNVGTPLASLVDECDEAAWVVCECSSFQLEDSSAFAPEVAVLLNLEEDHLDRHGTLERYRDAKLRVFANQTHGAVAIAPERLDIPGDGDRSGFADVDGMELRLRGAHNTENAAAAAAAALAAGVARDAVAEALRTFAGVAHRLEEVADVDGVLYVNDSKATNVGSAARGIAAFEHGVQVILGGSLKGGGFEGLRGALAARCRAAYLIGDAAPRLAADLDGTVTLHRCGTLENAVGHASRAAAPGDVVLLSPACASFDAFRDYEHRGDRFRELVAAIGPARE